MSFLWRKQEKIEGMLESYFERCDNCFQLFEQAFDNYCENGPCETFNHIVQRTHETESAADDLRRDIEHTLYGKALLPESRGDILGVLESFDKLPNMAETVIFSLRCQHTHIPAEYLPQFRQLTKINIQAYFLVRKTVDNLLNNPRVTLHSTKNVDEKESESDRVERDLLCRIFESDMELAEKLLLKDLVLMIGNISDRAEAAADRIGLVAIKRQI